MPDQPETGMQTHIKQRRRIVGALIAGTMVPLVVPFFSARAADATALDPDDPTAKALGYVTASAKAGANCANCLQFKGAQGAAMGPCGIFPGKQVASAGWCLSWGKKPA